MVTISKKYNNLFNLIITCCVFSTQQLLSANITNCLNDCECNDGTLVVKCHKGSLDVLPIALNPSIRHLIINNNKIKSIESSIQFYPELRYLDLSSNELGLIPERTFISQHKLEKLFLSRNRIIQLYFKTFEGLEKLITLNLQGNLIAELKQNIFSFMSDLKELNLGQNRISFIHSMAFTGLNKLSVLYLDDNTLTTIPTAINFQITPVLTKLYLGNNLFSSVDPNILRNLTELTHLDLHSTGLHYIGNETLESLKKLSWLDISDNRFEKVPTEAFFPLKNLSFLSISQNNFTVIDEDAFIGLKKLQQLEITNSKYLKRLNNFAFRENENLEYLNLSFNKLSYIQESVFSNLKSLKYLDLKHNDLQMLSEKSFSTKNLKMLNISDNPLLCDCQILWLKEKNKTFSISNFICAFPELLRGESFNQIPIALFSCSQESNRNDTWLKIVLVLVAIFVTALFLAIYVWRLKTTVFLCNFCNNSTLVHKDAEYRKTFSEDDQSRPAHLADASYPDNDIKVNIKHINAYPIPVTEL